MQTELIAAVAVHVLTAVFWAGTTFALARTRGAAVDRLFVPQMGAATIAILSGFYLWKLTHGGGVFGQAEQVLSVGALCAVIALGVQGVLVAPKRIRSAAADDEGARTRLATAYRMSAGLLIITLLAMTSARYL